MKISVSKLILLIVTVIALTACATSQHGNTKIDDYGKYMQLQIDKSDKRDVFLTFGQPHYVAYSDSGKSIWSYKRLNLTPSGWTYVPVWGLFFGGMNKEEKVAYFEFSEKGYLKNISSRDSSGYVNNWVGIAGGGINDDKPENAISVETEMKKNALPYDKTKDPSTYE
jgi:hypothetical protein